MQMKPITVSSSKYSMIPLIRPLRIEVPLLRLRMASLDHSMDLMWKIHRHESETYSNLYVDRNSRLEFRCKKLAPVAPRFDFCCDLLPTPSSPGLHNLRQISSWMQRTRSRTIFDSMYILRPKSKPSKICYWIINAGQNMKPRYSRPSINGFRKYSDLSNGTIFKGEKDTCKWRKHAVRQRFLGTSSISFVISKAPNSM